MLWHIHGVMDKIQVMDHRQRGDLQASWQEAIRRNKKIGLDAFKNPWHHHVKPKEVEQGVACLRMYDQGRDIARECMLIIPGTIEKEEKPVLRMGPGNAPERLIGKPADSIQPAFDQ